MMVKVFETNYNGKIEFTHKDLEKLLNEVYDAGYKSGAFDAEEKKKFTWTSPYVSTTPYYGTDSIGTPITYLTNEEDTSTATLHCDDATINNTLVNEIAGNTNNDDAKSYTVKIESKNAKDMSKYINDFFNDISRIKATQYRDAFTDLAKELNF